MWKIVHGTYPFVKFDFPFFESLWQYGSRLDDCEGGFSKEVLRNVFSRWLSSLNGYDDDDDDDDREGCAWIAVDEQSPRATRLGPATTLCAGRSWRGTIDLATYLNNLIHLPPKLV
jgi:hypothetical protein